MISEHWMKENWGKELLTIDKEQLDFETERVTKKLYAFKKEN